jgi:DNA-binding NarL/FixJ family response regulator
VPGTRRIRILIVDDTAMVRVVVRRVLESDGRFEVVGESTNGHEAIDHSQSLQPDLVLLDLAMPEMDGLEALPHIHRVSPDANVIVLSSFSPDQMGEVAISNGALSYIEKNRLALELVPKILAAVGALLDA